MEELNRNQLADSLGVSVSTIRKYERTFRPWLEATKGVQGQPIAQVYSAHDVRVLSTIHHLRRKGLSYEDIAAGALDKALEEGTAERISEQTAHQEEAKEARRELVPVEQFARAVAAYEATDAELKRTLDDLRQAREAIIDAERRAAAAAAGSDAIKDERDRLRTKLDELEARLEEARRPWYQKLFGGSK